MPKRIYALAKELTMDSKELVDLCTKIGIQNKGSALASLEDDEVERIQKYLAGSDQATAEAEPPKKSGARIDAPIRPSRPTSTEAKPRSLDAPRPKAKSAAEQSAAPIDTEATEPVEAPEPVAEVVTAEPEPEVPETVEAEPVAKAQPAPEPPAVEPASKPSERPPISVSRKGPSESARRPVSRDDYIPPSTASAGGRVRSLDARGKSSDGGDDRKKQPQKREPVIKVARMPKASQPKVPPPKSKEPAPQRPEIRFTKDDISFSTAGLRIRNHFPIQLELLSFFLRYNSWRVLQCISKF